MKPLLVYLNMGLGDAIIANGLVRHLAKERDVMFLCNFHNHPSVSWMFQGANVLTVAVASDEGAEAYIAERGDKVELLRLGCSGANFRSQDFDRCFYEQAGVPFEERWSGFHVERCPDEFPPPPTWPAIPFGFIHDDPERGFNIPRPSQSLPYIASRVLGRAASEPKNIFLWRHILEEADELHCIPSSFSVLWDSIPEIKPQKLYLHGSARPGWDKHTYKKNWQIV